MNDEKALFTQSNWAPRALGKLARVVLGVLLIWNLSWIKSDHYCLMYWIATIVSFVAMKPCINIPFQRWKSRNVNAFEEFSDNLPIFGAMSFCLWGIIIDMFAFRELYLFFWATDFVITHVSLEYGIALILSALLSLPGTALNCYGYLFCVYIMREPREYRHMPPVAYFPPYWVNKVEMRLYLRRRSD